jgi:type IV pilus assembly protein PilC
MPQFFYKAVDARGKSILGQIEALNFIDLEMRLKRMGLDLVTGGPSRRSTSPFRAGAVKRPDLINFCFHMEQLANAGVPLVDGLTDLRDTVENVRFKEVLSGVLESIGGGRNLSQSLAEFPDVFSPVFTGLIRAGEETGRLPQVLKELSENLKWEDELAAQTKKLMIYPAIVGSIVLAVVFFLMIYLVPQLVNFIKNMNQTLPLQTRLLIGVSNFFVAYWWAVIGVPVIAVIALRVGLKRIPELRYQFDRLKLALPLFGPVLRKIILSRFASTFAMMYSSGITILDAVRSSEETAGNLVVRDALRMAGQQIAEGTNVTSAFQNVGIFPPLVLRMLRVGESTGALDAALLNVSYFYNREVRESIARVQVMIEPVMTVVLGAILLMVMVPVFLPIYDAISKMKY